MDGVESTWSRECGPSAKPERLSSSSPSPPPPLRRPSPPPPTKAQAETERAIERRGGELLERVTAKRVGFVRLLSSPLPLNYCSLLCSSHRLPRPGSPLLLLLHRRLRRRSPFVRLSLSLGRTDSLPPPPPLLPPPNKSYYTPLPAPLTELTYPLHYSSLL